MVTTWSTSGRLAGGGSIGYSGSGRLLPTTTPPGFAPDPSAWRGFAG